MQVCSPSRVIIGEEKWQPFYESARALFPRHWKELALNQDRIKIDVDYEAYVNLEKLGRLMIVASREDDELTGYIIIFLMPHLHYKSAGTMALTDMYYVVPEARSGTGLRLFVEMEKRLRGRKVTLAMTSCKVHEDHQQFFEKLGWVFSDKTFMKYLG